MRVLSFDCGIKNLAFVITKYNEDTKQWAIEQWDVVNILAENLKKPDFYTTSNGLIQKLKDLFKDETNLDYVLIENQPCIKNPTMKSIQIIIYTYFNLHNCSCKVQLISASNKLKVKDLPEEMHILAIKEKAKGVKYKENKLLAILYAEHYVRKRTEDSEKWISFYQSHKKKDDLADSYLQVVAFTEKFY